MASKPDVQVNLALKIIRAELTQNFESFGGRMDPYAVVHWTDSQGEKFELSKTRVDWNAHMAPHWDHTCRAQLYRCNGETVEIKVLEANVMTKSSDCGSAVVPVESIVGNVVDAMRLPRATSLGALVDLPLKLNGKETGKVFVQALLVPNLRAAGNTSSGTLEPTTVPPEMFQTPVQRIGVSGGTAPFFRLKLRAPKAGKSQEYFIGKDLSRASDEVAFYEEAKALRLQKTSTAILPLLQFTFEYAGILEACEEGQTQKKPLELLVLRNLHDGCKNLRLLDIKIGQKTAQAGWQGKSRMAALRQAVVDGHTNSAGEGFRLEGFDGRPATLSSMDPLLDIGGKEAASEKLQKKALRIMLQRMTSAEMIMHFLDLRGDLESPCEATLQRTLSQAETAELVLHEVTAKLARLSVACARVSVPQKWIGSSVALGFDSGKLPSRSTPEAEIRRQTMVSIFDWGRSELNTINRHNTLPDSEQRDRSEYWRYYSGGVHRLSWEVARAYFHRFGNANDWHTVTFSIYDFDSMSDNDFISKLEVPVQPTPETTVEVPLNRRLLRVSDGVALAESALRGKHPKLTYSIEWQPHPPSSRLRGTWRVKLIRACNLPREDLLMLKASSDPLVEVIALSESGLCFRQNSSVKPRSNNPEWNEIFELPVARSPDALRSALASAGLSLTDEIAATLFPPEKPPAELVESKDAQGIFSRTFTSLLKKTRTFSSEDAVASAATDAIQRWEEFISTAELKASQLVEDEGYGRYGSDDNPMPESTDLPLAGDSKVLGCGCSGSDASACTCM